MIRSWAPNAVAVREDVNILHERIFSKIAELLDLRSSGCPDGLADEVEKCRRQSPHPLFFQWYFTLRDAPAHDKRANGGLCEEVRCLLGRVQASLDRMDVCERRYGLKTDVAADPEGMSCTIDRALAMARNANGGQPSIEVLRQLDDDLDLALQRAARLLAEYWLEMHAEISTLLKQLFVFRSEKVIGFVDFRSNGSVWLRESAIRKPLQLAEELIHEVSHVRLNVGHAVDPLFLNDDRETYSSPLRRDARPMFGVFHQMFVLCRLREFYLRVIAKGKPAGGEALRSGIAVEARLGEIEKNLAESFRIVAAHAKLTASGEALVREVSALEVVAQAGGFRGAGAQA
jgi:hypothetical protein